MSPRLRVSASPRLRVSASPRLVPLREDGTPDIANLNAEFSADYLADPLNPRWVAKPTVAYLWARSVKCKNCRATVPLLKTRWLCKKDRKRVLLTMDPAEERTGVIFGVQKDVPMQGGNAAQRREHDKRIGHGTMSRSGRSASAVRDIATMEDIKLEGQAGRFGTLATAVVVDGLNGQEYRLPLSGEPDASVAAGEQIDGVFSTIPYGPPAEPTPAGGGRGAARAFSIQNYGLMQWRDLFTDRQILALGTFCYQTRAAHDAMRSLNYPIDWQEAMSAGLAITMDRIADRQSVICRWDNGYTKLQGTFTRFALPITWDYCEGNPISDTTGNYLSCMEWVAEYLSTRCLPERQCHRRKLFRGAL